MPTEIDHPLLDPPTRAVLAMALLAFVLLFVGMIVAIRIGSRWAQRAGKVKRVHTRVGGDFDDQGKPLVGGLPRLKSDSQVDETVRHAGGVASDETIIENHHSGDTDIE